MKIPKVLNRLKQFILFLPLCLITDCTVHELAHFLFFKLGHIRVRELKTGPLLIIFDENGTRLSFCKDIFKGHCTALGSENDSIANIVAALIAGGLSGIFMAAIILLLAKRAAGGKKAFLKTLALVSLINNTRALFSPKCGDNKLIRKYINEMKRL